MRVGATRNNDYALIPASQAGFHDLQEALDQIEGRIPKRLQDGLERLEDRFGELERCLALVEEIVTRSDPAPTQAPNVAE